MNLLQLPVPEKVYAEGGQSGPGVVENLFYRPSHYWTMDNGIREISFHYPASPKNSTSKGRWTEQTNDRLQEARVTTGEITHSREKTKAQGEENITFDLTPPPTLLKNTDTSQTCKMQP